MISVATHSVSIFIAGDLSSIKATCRQFCLQGLCVTIAPTEFVFTGGSETGAVIELINYARFPAEPSYLDAKALALAKLLLADCCQRSCTVQTPTESYYLESKMEIPR